LLYRATQGDALSINRYHKNLGFLIFEFFRLRFFPNRGDRISKVLVEFFGSQLADTKAK